ncbi:HIV Tat-specific factor 1 homolog [Ischnura elegans]|uniref:HIV Tat-specific factor 1 homolog n=1 Tax=Ischnura elegans TaxID=197161 RepID=UPI001ED8B3D8|nr:HIV Tat-specific factor 1 homolog [Ischnura elegans]
MEQEQKDESEENKPNFEGDQSCYTYQGSTCIYTDPNTHLQYEWCAEKETWKERTSDEGTVPEDSSSAPTKFSDEDTGSDYVYDGETYVYIDKKEGIKYSWNSAKNEWVKVSQDDETSRKTEDTSSLVADLKKGAYNFTEDKHYYTDPSDGTVFEWDSEKKAWFPKVDEDFIAHYQMSYGFNQATDNSKTEEKPSDKPLPESDNSQSQLKRKEPPPPPAWFEVDDEHNTKVYVSNLPCELTETEFVEFMQKCGLVMKDPDNNRMKVKLYTDSEGRFKGDALCTYIKIESVELALKLLDGSDLKGQKVHVERARFQMKGDKYDANLKPRKKRKKDKEKLKKMQEKLFDWRPDKMRGERPGNERCVVIKNLFEPGIFDKNAALLLEYREDLREECSKCGQLKKVVIHDRHPEGIAQVFFQDAEEADICVKLLNGRWFGQRRLVAETWDGKTKYRIEETEEEREKRLQNWAKFLETGEGGPGGVDDGASATTISNKPAEVKSTTTVSASSEVAAVDKDVLSGGREGYPKEGSDDSVAPSSGGKILGSAPLSDSGSGMEANHGSGDDHSKGSGDGNDDRTGAKDDGEDEEVPEGDGETDSNPEGDSD